MSICFQFVCNTYRPLIGKIEKNIWGVWVGIWWWIICDGSIWRWIHWITRLSLVITRTYGKRLGWKDSRNNDELSDVLVYKIYTGNKHVCRYISNAENSNRKLFKSHWKCTNLMCLLEINGFCINIYFWIGNHHSWDNSVGISMF